MTKQSAEHGSWPQLISVTMQGGDSNHFTSYIQFNLQDGGGDDHDDDHGGGEVDIMIFRLMMIDDA